MSRAAQIRCWLTSNPGWHFAGDVCEGLGVSGKDRYSMAKAICRLAALGHVVATGKQGSKRYRLGRPARKYTKLPTGASHAN